MRKVRESIEDMMAPTGEFYTPFLFNNIRSRLLDLENACGEDSRHQVLGPNYPQLFKKAYADVDYLENHQETRMTTIGEKYDALKSLLDKAERELRARKQHARRPLDGLQQLAMCYERSLSLTGTRSVEEIELLKAEFQSHVHGVKQDLEDIETLFDNILR